MHELSIARELLAAIQFSEGSSPAALPSYVSVWTLDRQPEP
jgi:hypothetical protein